jgi:hypothetical protein
MRKPLAVAQKQVGAKAQRFDRGDRRGRLAEGEQARNIGEGYRHFDYRPFEHLERRSIEENCGRPSVRRPTEASVGDVYACDGPDLAEPVAALDGAGDLLLQHNCFPDRQVPAVTKRPPAHRPPIRRRADTPWTCDARQWNCVTAAAILATASTR